MVAIRVAAVSDIHAPRYLALFRKAMLNLGVVDIFILAGDIVDKNKMKFYATILYDIKRTLGEGIPVIAIFGNEEYEEYEDKYRNKYKEVIWLNDECIYVKIKNLKIAFIGTRGALDKPTSWQLRNVPEIVEKYRARVLRVGDLINKAKAEADIVILVTHYAPRCKNLEGEDRRIWSYLSSSDLTNVIMKCKPDIVIHGHAHRGAGYCTIDSVPVYNVALPARRSVTVLTIGEQVSKGILSYL